MLWEKFVECSIILLNWSLAWLSWLIRTSTGILKNVGNNFKKKKKTKIKSELKKKLPMKKNLNAVFVLSGPKQSVKSFWNMVSRIVFWFCKLVIIIFNILGQYPAWEFRWTEDIIRPRGLQSKVHYFGSSSWWTCGPIQAHTFFGDVMSFDSYGHFH